MRRRIVRRLLVAATAAYALGALYFWQGPFTLDGRVVIRVFHGWGITIEPWNVPLLALTLFLCVAIPVVGYYNSRP